MTEKMSGAHLQTLREMLHLSREELADLVSVQTRTIKHWEKGRADVPHDVAETIQAMRHQVEALSSQAIATSHQLQSESMMQPADIVVLRYHNLAELRQAWPDWSLPLGLHACLIGRLMAAAPGVRIVGFDAQAYADWRAGRQDTPAMRAAWAAEAG